MRTPFQRSRMIGFGLVVILGRFVARLVVKKGTRALLFFI
jgi:hypothetical protein